ncbi:chaperonin 10-like protein [Hyaloraphidium curvatum]|nr:chaperonin 10-like protein [Hyaloraphidium curvatum]
MNAVVFRSGQPLLETVHRPLAEEEGAVPLRVTAAGICGTDLTIMDGKLPWPSEGLTPGHEFGGFAPDGKLYAVRPTGACGACRECNKDLGNTCKDAFGTLIGIRRPGGLAEACLVDRDRLVPVPEGTDPAHVALVEPLAVAVYGVSLVKDLDKDTECLVYGAGTIGLMTVAVLAAKGITPAVVARHPHQAAAAEKLGGRVVAEAQTSSADVSFECVGKSQPAFDACVEATRPGGLIVELGGLSRPVEIGFKFHQKNQGVLSSSAYTPRAFAEAAAMIGELGPKLTEAVVTHRFPLRDAAKAFEAARDRKSGAIKVQIFNE